MTNNEKALSKNECATLLALSQRLGVKNVQTLIDYLTSIKNAEPNGKYKKRGIEELTAKLSGINIELALPLIKFLGNHRTEKIPAVLQATELGIKSSQLSLRGEKGTTKKLTLLTWTDTSEAATAEQSTTTLQARIVVSPRAEKPIYGTRYLAQIVAYEDKKPVGGTFRTVLETGENEPLVLSIPLPENVSQKPSLYVLQIRSHDLDAKEAGQNTTPQTIPISSVL